MFRDQASKCFIFLAQLGGDWKILQFQENDLYANFTHGGWTGERSRLNSDQFDNLIGVISGGISESWRIEALDCLNEIFADLVDDLRRREEKLQIRRGSHGWPSVPVKTPNYDKAKLTTRVKKELKLLETASRRARKAIENLSPQARMAILAYFRHFEHFGSTRIGTCQTFRETWHAAFKSYSLFQAACERAHQTGFVLAAETGEELDRQSHAFNALTRLIGRTTETTQDVLEQSFEDLGAQLQPIRRPNPKFEDPFLDVIGRLEFVESVIGNIWIDTKTGRDEVALRTMVRRLAEFYLKMTGKEPTRISIPDSKRTGGHAREAGELLDLAQMIARFAKEELRDQEISVNTSLTKIVCQVIKERKQA